MDRKTLDVLFEEQNLVLDGIVSSEERSRLARVWGVDAFLYGAIWQCGPSILEGTMKAMDSEAAEVFFGAEIRGEGGEAPARTTGGRGTDFDARVRELEAAAAELKECLTTMTESHPRVIELRESLRDLPAALHRDIQARIDEQTAADRDLAKLYRPADPRRREIAEGLSGLRRLLMHPLMISTWPSSVELDLGGGVSLSLVKIPPGKYLMGSPPSERGRDDDEGPQREVRITKSFYMGAFEVTQEQYEAVVGANPSRFKGRPRNPVETVSWSDAGDFCTKLSEMTGVTARLPTEAEWEYACRAGTTGPYAGDLDDMAWYSPNSGRETHPVGQKRPNNFGLYDMHGNVWEWCSDWYGAYSTNGESDPKGPGSGSYRVLRGGSWRSAPEGCRSAGRSRAQPRRSGRQRRVSVGVVGRGRGLASNALFFGLLPFVGAKKGARVEQGA